MTLPQTEWEKLKATEQYFMYSKLSDKMAMLEHNHKIQAGQIERLMTRVAWCEENIKVNLSPKEKEGGYNPYSG